MARWVIATLAVAASLTLRAQVDLGADRPGIGVGAAVLPPGTLQFEGGVSRSRVHHENYLTSVLVAGSPLIRAGLIRGLEFRFDGDGFRSETSHGAGPHDRTIRGLSDFETGAKITVVGEKRLCPTVAMLPSLSLPAGSRELTASTINPSLTLAWSKRLPESLVAGGNFAASLLSDDRGRFWRSAESLVVGFPLSSRLGGYAEVYRSSSAEHGGEVVRTFDGGISCRLGEVAQADLEGGRTLLGSHPSWFVGFGFVFRVRLPAPFRRGN